MKTKLYLYLYLHFQRLLVAALLLGLGLTACSDETVSPAVPTITPQKTCCTVPPEIRATPGPTTALAALPAVVAATALVEKSVTYDLTGKSGTESLSKVGFTIKKVEGMTEMMGSSNPITANGIFLVVQYEVRNEGDNPTIIPTAGYFVGLKDANDRLHIAKTSTDPEVLSLNAEGNYGNFGSSSVLVPGATFRSFVIYEVPKAATSFQLVNLRS